MRFNYLSIRSFHGLRTSLKKMKDYSSFDFKKQKYYLYFVVGEKTIFRLPFNGIYCNANIFRNPSLHTLSPPKAEMEKNGVKVAYINSCPLTKHFSKTLSILTPVSSLCTGITRPRFSM